MRLAVKPRKNFVACAQIWGFFFAYFQLIRSSDGAETTKRNSSRLEFECLKPQIDCAGALHYRCEVFRNSRRRETSPSFSLFAYESRLFEHIYLSSAHKSQRMNRTNRIFYESSEATFLWQSYRWVNIDFPCVGRFLDCLLCLLSRAKGLLFKILWVVVINGRRNLMVETRGKLMNLASFLGWRSWGNR
jgi:hypothetical protein